MYKRQVRRIELEEIQNEAQNMVENSSSIGYNQFNTLIRESENIEDVYKRQYFENPVPENMPVLGDLYQCLRSQREVQAQRIACLLYTSPTGSKRHCKQ